MCPKIVGKDNTILCVSRITRNVMEFQLINCSSVQVSARVDGKVIECGITKPTIIKGKEVDLFLPEYKDKEFAKNWSKYTLDNKFIQEIASKWEVADFFYPLSGKPKGGKCFNFRVYTKGKNEPGPYLVVCFIVGDDTPLLDVKHSA